jgi:CheY-like chemotaxis protein
MAKPTQRVMVVDDDPDIREVLTELLQEEGFEVATAANGAEALEVLASGPLPSVILLDMMMPVMNGFEFRLAQKMAAELAPIPVVIITAGADQRSRDLDAAAVFRKPLNVPRLLETIRAC